MPEYWAQRMVALGVLILVLLFGVKVAAAHAAAPPPAAIRAAVCQVFGPHCAKALAVARCETGGTFNPRTVGAAGELGLFQIHPVHFSWAKPWLLFVPRYNARAAYRLSKGGTSWRTHWRRCG